MIIRKECKEHKAFAEIDEEAWKDGQFAVIDAMNVILSNAKKSGQVGSISCAICHKVLYSGPQIKILEHQENNNNLLLEDKDNA